MAALGSADDIRDQMAAVRVRLDRDAEEVRNGAQRMTDWKHYVRSYPWASVGVAALVGYTVVPRRLEIISPDAAEIANLARSNRLVVESQPRTQRKHGLLASALRLASHTLLRAGIAYAGQQIGQLAGHQAAGETATETLNT